jgi:alpha-D-xyloside xylohydrolase
MGSARWIRSAAIALASLALAACSDRSVVSDALVVERSGDEIRARMGELTAAVRLSSYRLAIRAGGELLTAESTTGGPFYERGDLRHSLTTVLTDRALPDGLELIVDTTEGRPATVQIHFLTPRTLEVTIQPPAPSGVTAVGERFDSPADERIYGLTERLRDSPPLAPPNIEIPVDDARPPEVGSLDRRGETVEMLVRPTISIYGPFYQSSRGYGLAVTGTAIGQFDLAASEPEVVSFRFETGAQPESRRLRFHVFHGPGHATILDEYTRLVGRPFVPPDWAFGHWRWRGELRIGEPAVLDGVALNADLALDLTMYEQLGIPAGVYVLDRPVLAGEFGFGRFAWDEERLPNPDAMLDALRRRGFRILTWSALWACGDGATDNGREALLLGLLAPAPDPLLTPVCGDGQAHNFVLDPTHPDLPRWWSDKLSAFAARYQLDGIKLDRGEEYIPTAATDIWADGRTGREVRNDYPTLQAKIHHDALAQVREDDFLVVTRSGYTGTSRWAIVWGGDTAGSETFGAGPATDLGLRSAIISQQRVAFLGYPVWGSDTGGYYEFKDREVFARWLEFSAFSGIMEIGGTGGPHAPWDMPTEPRYDEEMIAIYRRYTEVREELRETLVAAAQEARQSGLPIVRPLVFDFRDDPEVADRWDQYLFGSDLMVAPVWRSGERAREVYFPSGRWESLWNASEVHEGPRFEVVAAPLDVIPVYRRR